MLNSNFRKSLNSYAKINLFLDVVSKYKNGYHSIKSVFAEISLHDEIEWSINIEKKINITMEGNVLKEDNLVYKAAIGLLDYSGLKDVPIGINFYITKNIPMGGGLGGGSSNAAAVLKILNNEWNLNYSKKILKKIGAKIGADIPFFIEGGIKKVFGIGDIVKSFKLKKPDFTILCVFPGINIPTYQSYKAIDSKNICKEVYANKKKFKKMLKLLNGDSQQNINDVVYNKFEEVVFDKYNELIYIRNVMLEDGAVSAFMSGSGSTIIGLYNDENNLQKTIDNFLKIGYKTVIAEFV